MTSVNTYYLGQVDVPEVYVPVANLVYSNDGCGIFKYAISGDPSGFFHIKDDMLFLKKKPPYGTHHIDIHLQDPLSRFDSIKTDYSLTISPFYCNDENVFYKYTVYNTCPEAFSGINCYHLYAQAIDEVPPYGHKPQLKPGMVMHTFDPTLEEYTQVNSNLDFYTHHGADLYVDECRSGLLYKKAVVTTLNGVVQNYTVVDQESCEDFCLIGSGLPTIIHFQSYVIPDKLEVFNICEDPLKENPIDVYGPSGTMVDPDLANNDPSGTYIAEYYVCPECLSYCVTADQAGTAWALTAFDSFGEPIEIGNPVYTQAGGFLGGDSVCYEQDCTPPPEETIGECADPGCDVTYGAERRVVLYPSGTDYPANAFQLDSNWTSPTTGKTYNLDVMFRNYDKYIIYQNERVDDISELDPVSTCPIQKQRVRGQHQAVVCSGGVLFNINGIGNFDSNDHLMFRLMQGTTDLGNCLGVSPPFSETSSIVDEPSYNPSNGSFNYCLTYFPDDVCAYCSSNQCLAPGFNYNVQFLDYFKFPTYLY